MVDELLFKVPENDAHNLRKEAAVKFLSLIAAGRPKEGLVFFTPDCITHNPYTAGDMEALTDAMIAVQKQESEGIVRGSKADFKLSIRQVHSLKATSLQFTRYCRFQPKRRRIATNSPFPI